jgi:hypothetical protein
MLIALMLLLADPAVTDDPLSEARLIPPPVTIKVEPACAGGFTRIDTARAEPSPAPEGLSLHRLFALNDGHGCPIPISVPVEDTAIGKELGREG